MHSSQHFNTNKPQFFLIFLQNTNFIRKPQVISGGGGAHDLHPPPRSAPVPRSPTVFRQTEPSAMRLQRAQNYFNVYFRAKDYKLKGRSEQSMFLVYFLDPVFIDWHV